MRHHPNDILLTGVPRSGTTLCCTLLNRNPGVLALVEPMRIPDFVPEDGAEAACERIARFLAGTRERALHAGTAPSLQRDGRIIDNPIAEPGGDVVLRPRQVQLGEVAIDRPLPPDFRLVVKHNALFVALLPALVERFAVYAVVREPLAVLASWNSVDLAVRDGHVPAGELYDPELHATLAAEPDRIERQLWLLDWFFARIQRHVPAGRIVRYEQLVAGTSQAAGELGVAAARRECEPRLERSYDTTFIAPLATALRRRARPWRSMYPEH